MRNAVSISAIASLFIATWAFAADLAGSDSVEAFFKEFAQKRDGVETLEARFAQVNVTPEETISSKGTVAFVKPRRIVFRYEEPDEGVTYLIDDRKAYEYQPDATQLEIYTIEDNPQAEVFFLGFANNVDSLTKAYDVSLFDPKESEDVKSFGEEAKNMSKGLLLKPKENPEEAAPFQEVRLFLRRGDLLPAGIHVVNDDQAELYITIWDFQVNEAFDRGKGEIRVVEGTKVVEDDQVQEVVGAGGKSFPEAQGASSPASDVSVTVEPLPAPGEGKGQP